VPVVARALFPRSSEISSSAVGRQGEVFVLVHVDEGR
jgi:hypothetical protein